MTTTAANSALPVGYRKPITATDSADRKHAAGALIVSPDGDVLLLHRAKDSENYPSFWNLPGGGGRDGEAPIETALRECREEAGDEIADLIQAAPSREIDRVVTPRGLNFHTFAFACPEKPLPRLNGEHSGFAWAPLSALPRPLHPSVEATLRDQVGAAEDMTPADWDGLRDGLLKWIAEEQAESEHDFATDSAPSLALDRDSVRSIDRDGRLRVAKANISKAAINPYRGSEIPGWQSLGLDPDKIYQLYRDPAELKKAAATLNGVPLLRKHVPVGAEDHKPYDVVGAIGTEAAFDDPYLTNSLIVWSGDDIRGIESGAKKELSAGYHYTPDMTPGQNGDKRFDGVMRDIVFNHVALVEDGRAGSDVVVGDSALKIAKDDDYKRDSDGKFASSGSGGGSESGGEKEVDYASEAAKVKKKIQQVKAEMNKHAPASKEWKAAVSKKQDLEGDLYFYEKNASRIDPNYGKKATAADSTENLNMKPTRLAALTLSLTAAHVAPLLAMDQKLTLDKAVFTGLTSENFQTKKPDIIAAVRKALTGKLHPKIAMDESTNGLKKLLDALGETVEGTDESASEEQEAAMEAAAEGESDLGIPQKVGEEFAEEDKKVASFDAEPLMSYLKDKGMSQDDLDAVASMLPKPATDADLDDEEDDVAKKKAAAKDMKEKDMVTKQAMDEALAAVKKSVRETERHIRSAIAEVKPWIGEVPVSLAFDSAEDVYRHALRTLDVDGAATLHADALLPVLKAQPKPGARPPVTTNGAIAMDTKQRDDFSKLGIDLDRIASI